jgi:hypothetical protein
MKVRIGPYTNWIGPYQIADKIFFWVDRRGISSDDPAIYNRWDYRACDKFGKWLSGTCVGKFCNWIHERKKRKVKIRIDPYDTWSMDSTLAYIIHPMLVQLKATKHGAPYITDDDVPEHIRSTSAKPKTEEWDTDEFHFDRWDWVLDEMIWTFETINTDWDDAFHTLQVEASGCKVDWEGSKLVQDRITNGLRLFGKYYQNLWD